MRQVWNIALNHLRGALNSRITVVMTFIVPVIMMFFLGTALNFSAPSGQVLDVVRDPADDLSLQFISLLRAEGSKQVQGKKRYIVCDLIKPSEQDAACKLSDLKAGEDLAMYSRTRVDSGTVVASIKLPATFTADLQSGKQAQIAVLTKGSFSTMQAVQQEVDAVNARLGGAVLAARVVTAKAGGDGAFFDKVYTAAEAVWAKDPVQINEVSSTTTGTAAGSGFGQTAPGIGAMFVMISALMLAEIFIQDRKQGTMQRMMVMPVTRAQVLAGKLLGHYMLGLITFALMVASGTLLGVKWGDWLGVAVVVLAYTLAVTALGLAMSTLVRTSGQAAGIRMLISLVLPPLGGAWWALDIVPQWMQQVGKISPVYWSQAAFSKMIFYGAHFPDILPSIAVLLVFAIVFFSFGLARYRYE